LLSYAIPVQFLPLVLFGLYWRGATRRGGELGLASGLLSALGLFALQHADPAFYALVNPGGFEIGFLSVAVNAVVLVCVSLWTTRNSPDHLAKFELGAG
jgi:SSS family solute:Na+ symporter